MLMLRLWEQSKDHWHHVPLKFIRRQTSNYCSLFCNFLFHINIAEAKRINAGLLNCSLHFAVQPYAAEQNLINLFCQNKKKLKPWTGWSWTPTENMELTLYHPHWDTGAQMTSYVSTIVQFFLAQCFSIQLPCKHITAALSERFLIVISFLVNLNCDYFDHAF